MEFCASLPRSCWKSFKALEKKLTLYSCVSGLSKYCDTERGEIAWALKLLVHVSTLQLSVISKNDRLRAQASVPLTRKTGNWFQSLFFPDGINVIKKKKIKADTDVQWGKLQP